MVAKFFWLVSLVAMGVLFFWGGPDYFDARSFRLGWNLGHIVFFALLPWHLVRFVFPEMVRRGMVSGGWGRLGSSFGWQAGFVFGLAVFLGGAVEIVQLGTHRYPDLADLYRDMIGAMVAFFFLLPARKVIALKLLRCMQGVVVGLVLLQVYPVAVALSDELRAARQFPVLSNFESMVEIGRWEGGAEFSIDDFEAWEGRRSLRVSLETELYSGVALHYFPGDWEGYGFFQFRVLNPDAEEIRLTCRIHDRAHVKGEQRYSDRFNRSFVINADGDFGEFSFFKVSQ